jgi:hypothetical protein
MSSFTKDDLKPGMWAKTRNANLYFVTYEYGENRLIFTSINKWDKISNYSFELLNNDTNALDIVEVFKPLISQYPLDAANLVLIWKREEPKKMTVAEIEAALGYPVEIVSGEGET